MDEIRRQFQDSSIAFLKKSIAGLEKESKFSKEFWQELFRRIHTIKGSAQTFGMPNTSSLAHSLENILELFRNQSNVEIEKKNLLVEGFKFLALSIDYPDFIIPDSFVEKIEKISPPVAPPATNEVFLTVIPPKIYDQLTEFEKVKLQEISEKDKNLISVDAIFDSGEFTVKLRELQNILNRKSEIIFTLPSEKAHGENEIGFQIFLSTDEKIEAVKDSVKDFNAEVNVLTEKAHFTNDLSGVLSKIVSQGKIWANGLGKTAKFKVLADDPQLDSTYISLIFDILLHLVRNAVDHSFDKKGNIEIRLKETDGGINLTLSDDGKGIDPYLVRAKAVEQGMILSDTPLSEQETLELIFVPGFSTAERVTEISGRGVGLDTVQNLVVNARGTISVESRKDVGTTFEIFLPLDTDN